MGLVSFNNYEVTPRYDNTKWTQARINESNSNTGPWTVIDTVPIDPGPDPAHPLDVSFTTEKATLAEGWYLIEFLDTPQANVLETDPVLNAPPGSYEILASLDDINAHLDGTVVEADAQNSALPQVSVNRVVKAYLSRVIPNQTMATWTTPENTPTTVREAASFLIASTVYFNATSKSTTLIEQRHYAQWLYDQGIALLNGIVDGSIVLDDTVPVTPIESLTTLDYFPIDATDRAFTMGQKL
jgi:hypothetical protein